jgi:hypothetical protein
MEEFQTTVSLRKARLSGEGKAIEEKSLITTVIVSKRRGGSLGRTCKKAEMIWSKQRSSKARRESSDKSEIESENSNEEVVDIRDSIEVL